EIYYCELKDLFIKNGMGWSVATEVELENSENYYNKGGSITVPLDHFDIIWMRKDPPFNMDYVYSTYILGLVDESKTHVINHPKGIRDSNEKLYSLHFKEFTPPTFVSKDIDKLKGFLKEVGGKMVVKPLDGYGGEGIFFVSDGDYNSNVILDSITNFGHTYVMAQSFIENVSKGD
ncbi:MAG: glutathione synthase, partial [Candidatus Dadabacteria bacterium]|nr:glutathione synthase [Candidatus Dadabacteria bacterium]NIQ14592.1 glutathione synthase [Candidatus Dadabacteria bacterium]